AGDDTIRTIDFVASHGLTIYHDGPRATTLQIGRPYDTRDALRATVVWDFRSADCALGGEGAPLVPLVDALLLASGEEDRIAVNLGGIANLTILRRGAPPDDALAFDSGPGMMLLDAFVAQRTGEPFDRNGRYTRAGTPDRDLLARLLADSYFAKEPPKSTGRERFGTQVLEIHRSALERLSLEEGCATLAAFTVEPLAAAIRRYAGGEGRVVVAGGGARNGALLDMLRIAVPRAKVETSAEFGLDPDAKEAIAFAILGYETLRGRTANLPRVTGARQRAVLGSIVPHELPELLAKIAREVEANG
ncbi:MAG: anhydro-N-acetylmuramic acid kinase, partial [Candidatus Eremiobacteraeota bacterium]|nr:anhydro-N-acetylmuramic acid kinase [Candidatus Eremiobacteraeota bacterium]